MASDTTCSCWIESKDVLRIFVDDWIADPNPSRHVCGQIDTWDVSRVTDMSYLFCALQESWTPLECDSNRQSFNADISGWDVSKVTSLEGIFMGTTSFDLTHMTQWNVSQVRTFDRDIFTYLNPRYDVCTERNIRLAAKDGVRWCFFSYSISVSLSLSLTHSISLTHTHTHTHTHTQVRLKPPPEIKSYACN